MEQISIVLWTCCLVFFTAWLTYLSNKINNSLESIDQSSADVDEIREGVEVIAHLMNKLPEMMPSFNMNTSPLQPLVEAFVSNFQQNAGLRGSEPQRAPDGLYIATTKEEIKE